jgi:hypothetical protein
MIHFLRDGVHKYEIFWRREHRDHEGDRRQGARRAWNPEAEPGAVVSIPVERVPARHSERSVVRRLSFGTVASALGFLEHVSTNPLGRLTLRTLLGKAGVGYTVGRSDDGHVSRAVASRLVSGELVVLVVEGDRLPGSLSVPEILTLPVIPERRGSPGRSTPQGAPQESTLPPEADPVAIADVLKAAARDGVPFCEECMRSPRTT